MLLPYVDLMKFPEHRNWAESTALLYCLCYSIFKNCCFLLPQTIQITLCWIDQQNAISEPVSLPHGQRNLEAIVRVKDFKREVFQVQVFESSNFKDGHWRGIKTVIRKPHNFLLAPAMQRLKHSMDKRLQGEKDGANVAKGTWVLGPATQGNLTL